MGYFPIFIDIKDKNILIVGGGKVALRKARTLLKYDANITIISPNILNDFRFLDLQLKQREFLITDLENKFLVVCATNDIELNTYILEVCNQRRILCNSATATKNNGYLFPAIIKQEDISIGINTSGRSPYISSKIKSDIERDIIPKYSKIIELSSKWRSTILKEISNREDRGNIIKYLIDLTLKDGEPSQEKIEQIIKKYR